MTEEQIKHMVDRFLGWRLPEDFHPDAGISFKPTFNDHLPTPMKHNPIGTNLFHAQQAEASLALQRVLNRRVNQPVHRVAQEHVSIRDGLDLVMEQLRGTPRVRFEELFPENASRSRIIVTFLAILELIKVGAVTAIQEAAYGEIEVVLVRDLDPDSVLAIDFEEAAG